MTEKYLIEVYVPYVQKTYDVLIPSKSKVGEISVLLSQMVADLTFGQYSAEKKPVLCDSKGILLNINASAEELELINGTKLLLI